MGDLVAVFNYLKGGGAVPKRMELSYLNLCLSDGRGQNKSNGL